MKQMTMPGYSIFQSSAVLRRLIGFFMLEKLFETTNYYNYLRMKLSNRWLYNR